MLLLHECEIARKNRNRRGPVKRLVAATVLASVLFGCGGPKSYPLRTCVVCDQPLGDQALEFVHEGQKVKVCSEEHRVEFDKDPVKYLRKIKEVKVL
jgi:YHS domain-containing protein